MSKLRATFIEGKKVAKAVASFLGAAITEKQYRSPFEERVHSDGARAELSQAVARFKKVWTSKTPASEARL
ncbi:MAG: hypothetical protein AABX38_07585 [Candidatus Micrarchaeota archaeon]